MAWLYSLLVLLRDLAILAAGAGIAWWAWDMRTNAPRRRDDEASARMAADRNAADFNQTVARLEALAGQISTNLETVTAATRQAETRKADMVRIHRLLHATKEPFLTFSEIRAGLSPAPEEDALRRTLIELAGQGVVAQLEGDRYFIASDYEADEEES